MSLPFAELFAHAGELASAMPAFAAMSSGSSKRTRSQRVAALELPPGMMERVFDSLQRSDVLLRIALCAVAAILMWLLTHGWTPPLGYRLADVPIREVVSRVDFTQVDPVATENARTRAAELARSVYVQDPANLAQLRARLLVAVDKILKSGTFQELETSDPGLWDSFQPPPPENGPVVKLTDEERAGQFKRFKETLAAEGALEKFRKGIEEAFAPFEQRGLLVQLPAEHLGDQAKILVHPPAKIDFPVEVLVSDVLVSSASANLRKSLSEKLPSVEVAERVHDWLRPQLADPKMETLKIDVEQTQLEQQRAIKAVEVQVQHFPKGSVLVKAGEPVGVNELAQLRAEYAQLLTTWTVGDAVVRSLAVLGMFCAMYTLCGFYIRFRDPKLLTSLPHFFGLLCAVVLTVGLCMATARDDWHAEMVPLMLFGMTVAIAYRQELSLLISACVCLVVLFSIGGRLVDLVILMSAISAAIVMLGRIRTRSKLFFVGVFSAVVVAMTSIGVQEVAGRSMNQNLLLESCKFGGMAILAGVLMTCLLPFIERLYDVQTDLSLIELGDPAHSLLQELVRRAPGTYNHSITVASLAEAAAEAIGARGLLVRVGAYFHDIGKMLKPGYFVENQAKGDNRHESLVPAMSTLVIIAHVKDGADLGRQHHLPESIIDFIQQHHGTTLVEYFFRRASEQSEADPDAGEVDESSFRYPGPKPQTKEAAVLMLADAVESASRVLIEPTPARIESLVQDIAMKRLLDGQFEECGLTLQEVATIRDSLVKSLTAVYHGRVKYPDQRTA